jgi:hypothetical protein
MHRVMIAGVVVGLVGAVLVARGSAQPVKLPPPSDYVEIDGSKNPQDIPEWDAWLAAFRVLSIANRKGSIAVPASLGLSDADLRLVFAEAAEQDKRNRVCEERVERLRPLLGKEKVEVINERTRTLQLECRWMTLQARDRLLEALSAEGRTALAAWVSEQKAAMRVMVPKAELEHYKQPQ